MSTVWAGPLPKAMLRGMPRTYESRHINGSAQRVSTL